MDGASLLVPPDPHFVTEMIDDVMGQDDQVRIPIVETVHGYLRFLQEYPQYAGDPETLSDCVTFVDRALEVLHHTADLLGSTFEPADEETARLAERELRQIQLVRAVDELLVWLGQGRAVTGAGGLRRADIAPVAAMLGIVARGVNSKYDAEGRRESGAQGWFEMAAGSVQQTELKVQSMWEIEELTAWWRAMEDLELLEFGSTRVYPGPAVDDWASEEQATALGMRQQLIALFISELLGLEAQPYQNAGIAGMLADRTIPAVAQMLLELIDPDENFSTHQQSFGMGALRSKVLFATLERQGVVSKSGNEYWVPEGLRPAVAQALLDISVRFPDEDEDGDVVDA